MIEYIFFLSPDQASPITFSECASTEQFLELQVWFGGGAIEILVYTWREHVNCMA